MAYTITLTNGTTFATVADGTINTDSSMTLVGKNYAGYGEFLGENFMHLLETGANSTEPASPLRGQLWWDSGSADQPNSLKAWTGLGKWQRLAALTSSAATPAAPHQTGDLWWDVTNGQLKAYNGTAFITVGPAAASGLGNTGAIPTSITDSGGNTHVAIQFTVSGDVVGIVSKDPQYIPTPSITGFANVRPGITLANVIGGQSQLFNGIAADSQKLDGLSGTSYLSSIANDTTTGTLGILNDGGLSVGAGSDLVANIVAANSTVQFINTTNNANTNIIITRATTPTVALNINGSTGAVGVIGIVNLNSNAAGNIGSESTYFNRVFATSTSALYADVAERFEADELLEPGTVVELGGRAEITKSLRDLSEEVFGVISTRAAFLMNGGAGKDETHPPVAMTGRVPVKVIGTVAKGDRLVSAGAGFARKAAPGEASAFNTIGRALVDKVTQDVDLVEAIVTIK